MATEEDRMEAYSAVLRGRLELEKKLQEQQTKTAEAAKKLAAEIARDNEKTMTSTEKIVADFVDFSKTVDRLLTSKKITKETATARMTEKIDEILPEFQITSEKIPKKIKNTISDLNVFAEEAARQMQQSFSAFLFDPFQDGLRGMLKGFVDMIRQMLAQIISQQLLVAFFGMFTGGTGFLANFSKAAISSIQGRASGGPVSAGRPYIVGERGPELFVPGSSGGIVPNGAMMGGMTVAPVYNIDARGATADLQSSLPGILQENNRRIFEELDRRYGVGR
jgi:polyhydroxyalkanoate synthesis regulator phasin